MEVGFFTKLQLHFCHEEPWRVFTEAGEEMRAPDFRVRSIRQVVDMPYHICVRKPDLKMGSRGIKDEGFFHEIGGFKNKDRPTCAARHGFGLHWFTQDVNTSTRLTLRICSTW